MSNDLIQSIKTFLNHGNNVFSSSDLLSKSEAAVVSFRDDLTLNDDPKNRSEIFKNIIQSSDRLNVLSGPPGSAKTYLAAAVMKFFNDTLESEVVGMSVFPQAVERLSEKSQMIGHTLNAFFEDPDIIADHAIVVIDEAGFLSTKDMIKLFDHGQKKQWQKIIFLGDYRQETHESGDQPLMVIEEIFPNLWLSLKVGFRQKTPLLRELVTNLYNAEANKALHVLEDSDNLLWVDRSEDVLDEAVMAYLKWRSEGDNYDKTAMILTQTPQEAMQANELVQSRIRTFSNKMIWKCLNETHALSVKDAQGLAMDQSFVAITKKITGQKMVSACSRHRYGIVMIVDRSIYPDLEALSVDASNFKLDKVDKT